MSIWTDLVLTKPSVTSDGAPDAVDNLEYLLKRAGVIGVPILEYGALGALTHLTMQAAIDDLPSEGGVILCPPTAVFDVADAIGWKSNVHMMGMRGGVLDSGGPTDPGTTFKWSGAAGGRIFDIFDCEHWSLRGFRINGAATASLEAIVIDSDNAIASHNGELADFSIENVGATSLANGKAIRVGTAGTSHQSDAIDIHDFWMFMVGMALDLESTNAFSNSKFESGTLRRVKTGVKVVACGQFTVQSVSHGAAVADAATFIDIPAGADQDNITVNDSETELGGNGVGKFLHMAAGIDLSRTVVLNNNQINDQVLIEANEAEVVGIGNTYDGSGSTAGAGLCTITASAVYVSIGEKFVGADAHLATRVTSGGAQVTALSPGLATGIALSILSHADGAMVELVSDAANPALKFTNTTAGRTFMLRFPDDGTFELLDNTAVTVPIVVEPGAPTNVIRGGSVTFSSSQPIKPLVTDTAHRPSASLVGAGASMYDTTIQKTITSDGTIWRDAAAVAV